MNGQARRDESGAVLILALGFVLLVGLVIVAIVQFAGVSFLTTESLSSQRYLESEATQAMTVAIQQTRTNYVSTVYTSGTPVSCLPTGSSFPVSSAANISVMCSGTAYGAGTATRIVSFYACEYGPTLPTGSSCQANPILQAVVTFDDQDPARGVFCSSTAAGTCGLAETVDSWDVKSADS